MRANLVTEWMGGGAGERGWNFQHNFLYSMYRYYNRRYFFQHAHFIPTVGVGKDGRIFNGPW